MTDLGEEERAEWQQSRDLLNRNISNYVNVLVYDECTDTTKDILKTPADKFEGGAKIAGRVRFVGIVWGSRVMGESSTRASVRMPPLHIMEVHRLFERIRSRHDRHNTTKALDTYDIYISLSWAANWVPSTSGGFRPRGFQHPRH